MSITLRKLFVIGASVGVLAAAYGLVIAPSSTPPSSASLLFDGRFETAGLNSWPSVSNKKAGNTNVLTYQTAIRRRSTGYAPKLEVGGSNGLGERIEYGPLNLWDNSMEGREVWIASAVYIPSGETLPSRVVTWQHGSKDNPTYCGAPGSAGTGGDQIAMDSNVSGQEADRWWFDTSGGVNACSSKTWQIQGLGIKRNVWYDWLVHYRFHSTTALGPITELFYRVGNGAWVNPVSDRRQPNLVRSSSSQGNFRWQGGLYKAESYTPYTTVYFGGMVIAQTRAAAEAAMFN